ncbi:MAG: maleylpyruvate isomerase family mycothiol-dependent enzyme [Ilumatobacteraceae bacterium]
MGTTAIDNLRACYSSLDGLLDGLDGAGWATQSLCPAWTVRGVVEHLGGIEHMLAGRSTDSFAEALPFGEAGAWVAGTADLDDAPFLARYRATITQRLADFDAMPSGDLDVPCATPVGPGTYGRFMEIRVFDFWVHEQDVRVPLGRPGHEGGPAAEMAIDEVHRSLPYIVGKKIGLPAGMSVTFELHGPVERTMHVVVDGRARLADEAPAADVTVRADSTTFVLLACGRIDPQGAIDAGRIAWSGSDDWGDRSARNLAFTM